MTFIMATFLCSTYTQAQSTSPEEYFDKLKTATNIGDTIDQYYNIGYWYNYEGNNEEGNKYMYSGIEQSRKNHLLLREAKGYYLAAENFSFASMNDSAGYYARQCITTYDKAGEKQVYYVYALGILASIALENAEADEATRLGQQQMEVAVELNDTASISISYTTLAAIYQSVENKEKAIEYVKKALELDRASGKLFNRAQALCNLAMLYIDYGHTDSAAALLYEAMHVATTGFPSDRDRCKAETLLGIYYHKTGHEDSAYLYLDNVKKEVDALEEPDVSLRFGEAYAEVCRFNGRYDTALAHINKSIAISEQYDISDHYSAEMRIRSGILADMGRYREAYEQYVVYTTLEDSLSGLKVQQTIAELGEKYESEKKDARIAHEKENNKRLTTGLGIVALLAILVLAQYFRQRAANKTISRQSEKLTLLMKELHHRVKNNLQIISSLLSLQSFRIKDSAASKAVREGQQRIEAMSLIHQRLYTRDNITEINIREFISDLVDSLQSAYGYDADNIAIKLDIDNELMNVDQAIPLNLIINELVTNAFKYAYVDNSNPELSITLKKKASQLELTVADNGKGINIGEWKDKEGSFGKELIQTFVKQLNGHLSLIVDGGTRFTLTIPYTA